MQQSYSGDIDELPVINDPKLRLFVTDIESGDRSTRRRREQQAVARLIEHVFGPQARCAHTASGAPVVEGLDSESPGISLSHSARFAALVTGGTRPIGVDIEEWRPAQLRRVADRFLSADEREIFLLAGDLLWAWAAKEAVYKAAGIRSLAGPDIRLSRPYAPEAEAAGRTFKLSTLVTTAYTLVVAH